MSQAESLSEILQTLLETDQPKDLFDEGDGLTQSLRGLSETIADFLKCQNLHAPALLAGDWGSGKTSLLNALKYQLEGEGHTVLVFDTWVYQHEDNLFQILCAALLGKVAEKLQEGNTSEAAKKAFSDIAKKVLKYAGVVGSKALKGFLTKQLGREFMDAVDSIGIAKDVDKMEKVKPEDDFFSYRSAGEELQTAFFDVMQAWKAAHPPIILVDDLDRCPPDRAIDLLDAIRTLLSAMSQPGLDETQHRKIPQFLVALDRDMMVDAISQKFEGIQSFDGNRYLEKVFPYCFYLPTGLKEDAVELLRDLIEPVRSRQDTCRLSENSHSALQTILSQEVFANPRLIKRTLNRFLLFKFASQRADLKEDYIFSDGGLDFEKTLVSWIAACERWPMLRTILQRRREGYWTDMAAAVKDFDEAKMPGPLAKKLISQQAALAWLKQESILEDVDIRQNYRRADDALRTYGL